MLIDCDTCTVRGTGCADCVVTVLLGAPPGWRDAEPAVVRFAPRGWAAPTEAPDEPAQDVGDHPPGVLVDLDEIERRAVRALAEGGLVPPLRHQSPTTQHTHSATEGKHKVG